MKETRNLELFGNFDQIQNTFANFLHFLYITFLRFREESPHSIFFGLAGSSPYKRFLKKKTCTNYSIGKVPSAGRKIQTSP